MRRTDKAGRIEGILDDLYPETPIPLSHGDSYTLLVAVILSAQCTDKRVNEITPGLFELAATPLEMIRLTPAEIEAVIRPCGLGPSKSKNIWKMSHQLLADHAGVVPDTLAALESLAGVGHKTASVVLCQAFGKAAFPVDTHIHRLAARWGLSSGKSVVQTERDLKRLIAEEHWGKVHLQLIYFGREHCPARGHQASVCPICSWASPEFDRSG